MPEARVAGRQTAICRRFARARAQVQHVIGGGDGVGIVLHHQDGVAQIAQAPQNLDEAVGIARMEADGGLIQHVESAHQMRAQRCGQLDALGLAAGKRRGQPVEREVFQADLIEKAQPLARLFENFVGDGGLLRSQGQGIEETPAPR
jgi:hypothetical protein